MIDANEIEKMAKERPDECFLKGSGVLKLTGAIRELEGQVRTGIMIEQNLNDRIAELEQQVAALVKALRDLEDANDALCKLRTREQYLSMLDSGQQDALIALDNARSNARAALVQAKTEGA